MSQKRSKKQLSMFDNASSLTDQELREALRAYNQTPGPITDSTRILYRKKLASLMGEVSVDGLQFTNIQRSPKSKADTSLLVGPIAEEDDSDDEDFDVQDEDLDDEDEDESEEEDYEDEEDVIDDLTEDVKLSSTTAENSSTALILNPDASANRVSGIILSMVASFFIGIFSIYSYSSGSVINLWLEHSQPLKTVARALLVLLLLMPVGYAIYSLMKLYRHRCYQDRQRVCELVNDVLELLQSPDNPRGMMPILHIRDTLLTPAERKSKKINRLWSEAVKFVENNESRVKVELVNIDGEDFRAWKWIGARKI